MNDNSLEESRFVMDQSVRFDLGLDDLNFPADEDEMASEFSVLLA